MAYSFAWRVKEVCGDDGEIIYWEYNVLFQMLFGYLLKCCLVLDIRCQIFIVWCHLHFRRITSLLLRHIHRKDWWHLQKLSGEPKQACFANLWINNYTKDKKYYVPDKKFDDICNNAVKMCSDSQSLSSIPSNLVVYVLRIVKI